MLGFSYDHVELNIYCNGKNLDTPILGIKGTVFPVFFGKEALCQMFLRLTIMMPFQWTREQSWTQSLKTSITQPPLALRGS